MHKIDSLIGSTARLNGDIEFAGGLHLDGRISGDVHSPEGSDSTLTVSERGVIKGAVHVANVILEGHVNGSIHARGRVVLGPKSRVDGDVYYGVIEMSLGAEIKGKMARVPQAGPAGAPRAAEVQVKFG